ncbi:MAG: PepSY domain-containing protein [Luteimonas sp.]|nr:PepSY domain-containing protein [Luteimonas sp.]
MNKTLISTTVAIPLVLFTAIASLSMQPAHAGKDDQIEARALLQRGEILPLGRILQIVQERVPGDIIEVELDLSDKHGWEYEVKVLATTGRVLDVDVNARTGEIRKIEDD